MADNDQNNDEYKFAELDALDNDPIGEMDNGFNQSNSGQMQPGSKKDIKRNALIVIVLVVLAMVMYKLIGYLFFSPKTESAVTKNSIVPVTQTQTQTQPQPVVQQTVTPVVPVQTLQPAGSLVVPDLAKKVSAIEISQQSVKADLSSVSQQVGVVNSNVNNLNNQIASLNQVISNLSNQMAKQSEEISTLMARSQPKQIKKAVLKSTTPPLIYTIQAVIPGRAWIIGSNGSTLTVREGTKISGYGTVKLIDSMQGRILMSSGRVIRFSQEDS